MNDNKKSGFLSRAASAIVEILKSDKKAKVPNTRAEVRRMLRQYGGGFGRLKGSRRTFLHIIEMTEKDLWIRQISKRPVRHFGTFSPVRKISY